MNVSLRKQKTVAVEVSPLKAKPQQACSKQRRKQEMIRGLFPNSSGFRILTLNPAFYHLLLTCLDRRHKILDKYEHLSPCWLRLFQCISGKILELQLCKTTLCIVEMCKSLLEQDMAKCRWALQLLMTIQCYCQIKLVKMRDKNRKEVKWHD